MIPLTARGSRHGRGRGFAATGRGTKDSAFQAEERSAPPSLWGGIAATALLGRAASAAFDAGSPWVGRPESIQSKGVPAAPRAVGNKEMVPPGGTREKSPGPGSPFAYLKPKCAPAPHEVFREAPLLEGVKNAPCGRTEKFGRALRGNPRPPQGNLSSCGPRPHLSSPPAAEIPASCAGPPPAAELSPGSKKKKRPTGRFFLLFSLFMRPGRTSPGR